MRGPWGSLCGPRAFAGGLPVPAHRGPARAPGGCRPPRPPPRCGAAGRVRVGRSVAERPGGPAGGRWGGGGGWPGLVGRGLGGRCFRPGAGTRSVAAARPLFALRAVFAPSWLSIITRAPRGATRSTSSPSRRRTSPPGAPSSLYPGNELRRRAGPRVAQRGPRAGGDYDARRGRKTVPASGRPTLRRKGHHEREHARRRP